jgi:hypothetical protein
MKTRKLYKQKQSVVGNIHFAEEHVVAALQVHGVVPADNVEVDEVNVRAVKHVDGILDHSAASERRVSGDYNGC